VCKCSTGSRTRRLWILSGFVRVRYYHVSHVGHMLNRSSRLPAESDPLAPATKEMILPVIADPTRPVEDETKGRTENELEVTESRRLTSNDPMTDLESGRARASEGSTNQTISSGACVWLRSQKFIEQVCCVVYLLLCLVPMLAAKHKGNIRPIPYQYLEDSKVYVRNLVNNESSKGPTVNDSYLLLFGIILPYLVQSVTSFCWGRSGDTHSTFCATLVSQGSNLLATECLKLYVGYLRPIFYELCVPSTNYQQCTGSSHNISESQKSFPSGHASVAFCGLTLLAVYLHNRFGISSVRRLEYFTAPIAGASDQPSSDSQIAVQVRNRLVYSKPWPMLYRFLSVFFVGAPMSVAAFIAASRVFDNYHFPADVVAGSLLGSSISLFIHGVWFDE
jgi:diacylglycerol diphosphate phosphatase / phosphatidate phosphatase